MKLLGKLFETNAKELPQVIKEALDKNREAKGQLLHKTTRAITDMSAMDQWAISIERRHGNHVGR